jgi:DNA (cytosine-5)-methyltransferase 1
MVHKNTLTGSSGGGSGVFHEVQADLEAAGYEVWPYVLAAAGVGAPHRRDRVWFVAHAGLFGQAKSRKRTMGVEQLHEGGDAADTHGNGFNQRHSKHEEQSSQRRVDAFGHIIKGNGDGDAADTSSIGLERKCRPIAELEGQFRFGSTSTRNIQCATWDNFPTKSPICGRDDGIPNRLDGITFPKWRNESIKAYGNAVVPQVVYQIFKAIQEYENLNP